MTSKEYSLEYTEILLMLTKLEDKVDKLQDAMTVVQAYIDTALQEKYYGVGAVDIMSRDKYYCGGIIPHNSIAGSN